MVRTRSLANPSIKGRVVNRRLADGFIALNVVTIEGEEEERGEEGCYSCDMLWKKPFWSPERRENEIEYCLAGG